MTIFYSICCTLEGKDASTNPYIRCLFILYDSLRRSNNFVRGKDMFYVFADSETAKHIPSTHFAIIYVPRPKTLMEIMSHKYRLHKYVSIHLQTVAYMDTDILAIRRFQFPSLFPNEIAVFPEGDPQNNCYRGDNMPPLFKRYGVTAGFFFYNMSDSLEKLFDHLAETCQTTDLKLYALDQPFFNRFLPDNQKYLDPRLISFNGNNNQQTACFVNCAGEPGNAELHAQKMTQFFMNIFNRNGGGASQDECQRGS